MKHIKSILCLLALMTALSLLMVPSNEARPAPEPKFSIDNNDSPSLSAQPVTIDQITHNKGNIVTTVDNWGYIGGYHYYGLPSGEWPRNSGHDYIGELKFWMGATTASGDTLVANSYDDFEAVPMPIDGNPEYKIYLSTDTTRYYAFDPADTIYQEHFPGNPVVPGSLIIGAFLDILKQRHKLSPTYTLKQFRFKSFVAPGEYHYEIVFNDACCKCRLFNHEKAAVTGEVMI